VWVGVARSARVFFLPAQVLPLHFRHNKLTSFQRQLNLYGFQRIAKGSEAGRYKHEQFIRGRPESAAQIRREAKDELGNRVRPGGPSGRSSGGHGGRGGGFGNNVDDDDDDDDDDGDDGGCDDYLASWRAQPPRPGGRSGTRGHSHAALAVQQPAPERKLRPSHAPRHQCAPAPRDEEKASRYAPGPDEEAEDDRSAALAMLNIARSLSTESLKPEALSLAAPDEAVGLDPDAGRGSGGSGEGFSEGFGEGGRIGGGFNDGGGGLLAALAASRLRESALSAQVARLVAKVANLEAALHAPRHGSAGAGGDQAPGDGGGGEEGGDSDVDGSVAGEKRRWFVDARDGSGPSDDGAEDDDEAVAEDGEARKRAKKQSESPPPSPGESSGSAGSMPSPASSRSTSDRCLSPAFADSSAVAAQVAGQ
jgi:hypothetical protein